MEDIALWHERDISHSSVERVIIPDSTILVDYLLNRLTEILKDLQVYPQKMLSNIERSYGLHNSQRILLALVEKGVSREEAYGLVQKNAMESWNKGVSFMKLLKDDSSISRHISAKEIEELFDLKYYLKHIGFIFDRVFHGQSEGSAKR
jgi:adenylosuccinate lyase